jgi:secreted trypsin-like serine protease
MNRKVLTFAIAAGTLAMAACEQPVAAPDLVVKGPSFITNGSLDGNAHPAVVLIIMDIAGSPAYRCSGTLISSTVVLTAGHCTGEPGEFSGMRIFTESDVQNGDNNYPYSGPNTIEAKSWRSHPLFTEAAFYLHDVGVIQLRKAVSLPSSAYGQLPSVDQEDALSPGSSTIFTAVGYGLQRVNAAQVTSELIRMTANPYLVQINTGFTGLGSLVLSNNANSGGTCFGDSGGPNYIGTGNVIGGVTSFGLNGSCGGTGGVFRVDRKDVLDFITGFMSK